MEETGDFSLCGKEVVTEANLRDEYYWRLIADFIGPQSGEGLELEATRCKNRLLIQVGLFKEDNNFPWSAITDWLRKIFPRHQSADFRRLIERGIATTLSLGSEARLAFLESDVNFNFVGPICDSIGVERQHLLEMRDFSEQAKLIEVTNGLILELNNFVTRERIAPVVMVAWLRNFNPSFCKNGDLQKAYKVLRPKIKKLLLHYRNCETRRIRRNPAMEDLLRSPFELVRKKMLKALVKKRMTRDVLNYGRVTLKEEYESCDIMPGEELEMYRKQVKREPSTGCDSDEEMDAAKSGEDSFNRKGESLTLLDIAVRSVQKLSKVYGGITAACKKLSLDLLRNHYTLTCREHPGMGEFGKKIDALCGEVNLASPVEFLSYNANFLVDLQDAVEKELINFEKEIILSTGEQLGRDKLQKFKKFVNMEESATSRYIHMACDILNPCTGGTLSHRRHWMAFCEEKNNPSRLTINDSNQFDSYFETAAGLIHHHKEIIPFFSDLLSLDNESCPNIILESLSADAGDLVIQSLVCVLAIIYCKILGPYKQLLKSTAEYSLFSHFMLCLYQKFLDWSKDPSTLLEPEGDTNVFMQYPFQEKTFEGVFYYCGQWHTNRPLIKACLKRVVKAIASVTDKHLKDFLPGGMFSQALSPEQKSELASCTFSVLMAEYPFGDAEPCKTDKPEKTSKRQRHRSSSDSSQEDDDLSGSSDNSSDESSGRRWKKNTVQYKKRVVKEELEENMDRDYIEAVVSRNRGPCKTQQDVDKMLVQFDGKPRAEKREAIRCEILYQKMVLHNPDPNLNCNFSNTTHMMMKLKLALPRVKPGFSLVWAPDKKRGKPGPRDAPHPAIEQNESSVTSALCGVDG